LIVTEFGVRGSGFEVGSGFGVRVGFGVRSSGSGSGFESGSEFGVRSGSDVRVGSTFGFGRLTGRNSFSSKQVDAVQAA
jgi:hypothetical protein